MTTPAEIEALCAFQLEAARYFRNRDTKGEDAAHWSNVANAENCEKAEVTLRALYARAIKAEAALDDQWFTWTAADGPVEDDRPVLIYGKWNPTTDGINQGGQDFWGIARWSTVQSNGTGHQWYLDFLTSLSSVNVTITNWRYLDKPIRRSAGQRHEGGGVR